MLNTKQVKYPFKNETKTDFYDKNHSESNLDASNFITFNLSSLHNC